LWLGKGGGGVYPSSFITAEQKNYNHKYIAFIFIGFEYVISKEKTHVLNY